MDLYSVIKDYHYQHLDDLKKHQLHFLSRLWLWDNDQRARQLLDDRRDIFLQKILAFREPVMSTSSKNIYRDQALKSFPYLISQTNALFVWLFKKHLYDIDDTKGLYCLYPETDLRHTYDSLLAQPQAIANISTQAANFISIYSIALNPHAKRLASDSFLELLPFYSNADLSSLALKCYLLTHAIIGQSLFYYQEIADKGSWLPLAKELDKIIAENYPNISLDIKFEYLVVCRLLGYESPLSQKIYQEADRSVSRRGSFLLDKRNNLKKISSTKFSKSEHRNVLFLMGCTQPQYQKKQN